MKKILVIDDDPDILRLLKFRLEKAGFETVTALDGMKGLELAIKEKPHLIILDIMMPGEDGYALCQKLKSLSGTGGIPVIFLSAKAEPKDISKGYESGGIYFITKPYDPDFLLEIVNKALENPLELEKRKWKKQIIVFTQDLILKRAIEENILDLMKPLFIEKEEEFEKITDLSIFDIVVLDLAVKKIDFKQFLQKNQMRFKKEVKFILIVDPQSSNLEEINSILSYPYVYLQRPFVIDELIFNLRY